MHDASHTQTVEELVDRWFATRLWGERLVMRRFGISRAMLDTLSGSSPVEVLDAECAGWFPSPGTPERVSEQEGWTLQLHGVGVSITRPQNRGGIDFDFHTPHPDESRLLEFLVMQLNAGNLVKHLHRPFLHDRALWRQTTAPLVANTEWLEHRRQHAIATHPQWSFSMRLPHEEAGEAPPETRGTAHIQLPNEPPRTFTLWTFAHAAKLLERPPGIGYLAMPDLLVAALDRPTLDRTFERAIASGLPPGRTH